MSDEEKITTVEKMCNAYADATKVDIDNPVIGKGMRAALSVARAEWQEERERLVNELAQERAKVEAHEVSNLGLRKRVHLIEGHNQWFERCESAWCNPGSDSDPATETGNAILAARLKAVN